MDQQRNLQPPSRRNEAVGPQPVGPEQESPLLREARGWSGSAREAHGRVHNDQVVDFLSKRRRNGPGQ
jgi:hypothetical protein